MPWRGDFSCLGFKRHLTWVWGWKLERYYSAVYSVIGYTCCMEDGRCLRCSLAGLV